MGRRPPCRPAVCLALRNCRGQRWGCVHHRLALTMNVVVELPRTGDGLRAADHPAGQRFDYATGVAVDSAGDVFIADDGNRPGGGIAADRDGLRAADHPAGLSGLNVPQRNCRGQRGGCVHRRRLQQPMSWNCRGQRRATGRRRPCRSAVWLCPEGVAVDSAGDVFIADRLPALTVWWNCRRQRPATGRR